MLFKKYCNKYSFQTNPPFTKSSMLYIGLFLVAMPIVPCVLYMKIFNRARMSAKRLHPNPPKNSIPTNSRDQEIQTLRGSATFPSHSGNKKFVI